ncbi:MAG TPA: tetratricopeptide repeat protein [Chloroflexia bacterium]|nr:tetratricopeptide repeat protein [Chloroflexia bacterium]
MADSAAHVPIPPEAASLTAPVPRTALIGRDHELLTMQSLIGQTDVRLITLTGAGGTGKTRLAAELADKLASSFSGGVFFVPLAAVHHPGLVVPTIAGALGVGEVGHQPLILSLKNHLRPSKTLLVLDNFEQIVAAAYWITHLLDEAPGLKVLVTSRERLHLAGEHEVPVAPLALPDPRHVAPAAELAEVPAVALFVRRAREVQPAFTLTAENAADVVTICRRLDGLPLAIELAAAQLQNVSLAHLLDRLRRGATHFTGGGQSATGRQLTIRATLDWSYNLLRAAEKELFVRLAVFTGGCTASAAEGVCDAGGDLGVDVRRGLAALAGKSLLRREDPAGTEPRYTMLETISEYASGRLGAGDEGPTLRRRLAHYMVDVAEVAETVLTGPQQRTGLDELEREHDNLRAVLEWSHGDEGDLEIGLRIATACHRFWQMRGYVSEGRGWLESLLARTPEVAPALRASALNAAATLAISQGDYAGAEAWAEQALALWRGLDHGPGQADALNNLGTIASRRGRYGRAAELFGEGLALRRALGDPGRTAALLNNLGIVSRYLGNYGQAQLYFSEAHNLLAAMGDAQRQGSVLLNLCGIARDEGDYARAVAYATEGLRVYRDLGNVRGIAGSLHELAEVARYQGDFATAAPLYEETLTLRRELGDQAGVADVLNDMGEILLAQGSYSAAQALFEQNLQLRQQMGDESGRNRALLSLGKLAHQQGAYRRARDLLVESLAMNHREGDRLGMAQCLEMLAATASASGQGPRAAQLWGGAEQLRTALGVPLAPTERALHDQTILAARELLDPMAWTTYRLAGQALSVDALLQLAAASE